MNIFVTVDRNWGIGQQEKRLVSIPADLRTLRDMVAGKVVVIGRKTMETLPFDLVRTARGIYVLSRSGKKVCREAVACPDVDALKEHLADVPGEDVYVLGGEETFRSLFPYCDTVHVTKIDEAYAADAWFPNLDESSEWSVAADSEEQTYFNLEYRFLMYKKRPAAE